MSLIRKRALWYLLAIAVFAAAFWFSQFSQYALQPDNQSALLADDQPDAWMKKIQIYRYDNTGRLAQTLQAEAAQQFDDQNLMLFDSPKLKAEAEQGTLWFARSLKGSLKDQTELHLTGAVRIDLKGVGKPAQDFYLTTSKLLINLSEETAFSNQPSEMYGAFDHINSEQLELDLKTQKLHLSHNVQGYHQARPTP
jgi:LPS export ABC transporter protein LptC